jgi:hypothetical protein
MRHPVDYLYSLYAALISINVPGDKARAVVDAMERGMGTTLATKADLQLLKQESKADLQSLRQDNALIRKDLEILSTTVHKDLELLSTAMTVRLGSLIAVGSGVLFAALKLT